MSQAVAEMDINVRTAMAVCLDAIALVGRMIELVPEQHKAEIAAKQRSLAEWVAWDMEIGRAIRGSWKTPSAN